MKLISVDIETTGLRWQTDSILCIGAWSPVEKHVFRGPAAIAQLDELLSEYDTIIGHNFSFDWKFLKRAGLSVESLNKWTHDSMVLAHTIGSKVSEAYIQAYEAKRAERNALLPHGSSKHRAASALSLKVLAPYFLQVPPFWEDPTNHDSDEYVLKDCEYTYRLFEALLHKASPDDLAFYTNYMMPWAKLLARTELNGLCLDEKAFAEVEAEAVAGAASSEQFLRTAWHAEIDAVHEELVDKVNQRYELLLQTALNKAAPEKHARVVDRYAKLRDVAIAKLPAFNIQSPSQLNNLLKNHLNLELLDDQGVETTGKAALSKFSNREDIAKLLEYKKCNKVLTMYLPTYRELQLDGVIHTNFRLCGTRTGRLSSSDINCQQVPSKLYRLFKPRQGYKLIKYDLASIEAALIALYSEDENLWNIVSCGGSLHNYNAKVFFDLDCDPHEVPDRYPAERRAAKTVGFSLFYGAGFKRIQLAMASAGYIITPQRAKQLLDNFRSYFRTAVEFHRGLTEAIENQLPIQNVLGRPIYVDRNDAYMKGFNTLIQSSASDLNLEAYRRADSRWQEAGLDARGVFLIHDCILAEARDDEAEEAARILRESMTGFNLQCGLGKLKLGVDGGISDKWEK